MKLSLSVAPSIEPVSLTEMKDHLHYCDSDQDTYIGALISAARQACESETDRVFLTQTWVMGLCEFPEIIAVPYPPLQSVEAITYYDENGSIQTLDSSQYQVENLSDPGMIAPARGCSWPTVDDETLTSIRVVFKAGWATADSVPVEIKHAIKLLTAHYFWNPSATSEMQIKEVPFAVQNLLTHWKTF